MKIIGIPLRIIIKNYTENNRLIRRKKVEEVKKLNPQPKPEDKRIDILA